MLQLVPVAVVPKVRRLNVPPSLPGSTPKSSQGASFAEKGLGNEWSPCARRGRSEHMGTQGPCLILLSCGLPSHGVWLGHGMFLHVC